jgi:hypothetical protein
MTPYIFHVVGGRGDPRDASHLEQDHRAVHVLIRFGKGQWPVCGRH